MPRVKNNVARLKRKRQLLADAKGFFGRRKNLYKTAKEAVERARRYAYRDRKNRKREFRRLWIVRINAAARMHDLSYSRFMDGLRKAGIEIDRKVLADLAVREPAAFGQLAGAARAQLQGNS
jgi:large subunit ribosomal protein L20